MSSETPLLAALQPPNFVKMHGLGNDFVVLDARGLAGIDRLAAVTPRLADRHTGIGFDQLVLIATPENSQADIALRFLNADGSESGACGNGTRCAAALVMGETRPLVIETRSGPLSATRTKDGLITVDMGPARLGWRDVPLAGEMDTADVEIGIGELQRPACCSMGNPHATFFVADVDTVDLAGLGPRIEHHPLFPERVNVGVASLVAPGKLRLRVWERGSGLTLACGSGACAAMVAASRRGLVERRAELVLERGSLFAEWRDDGHVLLTGPVATSFTGRLDPDLLGLTS